LSQLFSWSPAGGMQFTLWLYMNASGGRSCRKFFRFLASEGYLYEIDFVAKCISDFFLLVAGALEYGEYPVFLVVICIFISAFFADSG
jgi:hypothetical protein